ncbi:MAG: PHP domain-containing protein, partial [Nitrospirota bacterium]
MIRHSAGVRHAELVGELRRRLEVVRTISVLVSADGLRSVLEGLRQVEGLGELTPAGSTITGKSSLGVPVRIMVSEGMTAHAMLAASASEEHLAALSARAARMKVPWNLMGANGMVAPKADSEGALYAALALQFIEPELREGLGEIEAAESGRLKPLVEVGQIRGIFHNHTTYSDGSASLEDMVAAAKALGYRYIGISDHSQSAFYANGLKEDRVRDQHAAIDKLQKTFSDIRIFKGIEADILVDGAMDYPDDVLASFDFVIASVHSRFNLSEEDQTRRICLALTNSYVTMLGHATGRLLLSREGYRVDMRKVIDT